MSEPNVIPPMTHPWGANWPQPSPENILVDDTHALMSQKDWDRLKEYSCSQPSGVYPGKMWRRHDGAHDPDCPPEKRRWLFCWFGFSEKGDDYCSTNYREVLIV